MFNNLLISAAADVTKLSGSFTVIHSIQIHCTASTQKKQNTDTKQLNIKAVKCEFLSHTHTHTLNCHGKLCMYNIPALIKLRLKLEALF